MNRLEKAIQKKSKRKKLRFISKVLFILCMSINLMICIFIVDKNAKMMLGEKTHSIEPVIIEVQTFINEKIEYINGVTKELMVEFNK